MGFINMHVRYMNVDNNLAVRMNIRFLFKIEGERDKVY